MMELGLDKLLKMFEERFGRRPTTVLLALIGMAVAAWALTVIWDFMNPLMRFAGSVLRGEPQPLTEFLPRLRPSTSVILYGIVLLGLANMYLRHIVDKSFIGMFDKLTKMIGMLETRMTSLEQRKDVAR